MAKFHSFLCLSNILLYIVGYTHTHTHALLICSSVTGHSRCFHTLATVNKTSMNIGVHVPFWITCFLFLFFFGCMPRKGMARSYGSSTFSFLRTFIGFCHGSYTNLRFHPQCTRVPFYPYPLQQLLFVDFSMVVILTGVEWYLIALTCISLIISSVEHLFICLLPNCMRVWKNVYSGLLPRFLFFIFD